MDKKIDQFKLCDDYTKKLLPCPCCGNDAHMNCGETHRVSNYEPEAYYAVIECNECQIRTGVTYNDNIIIACDDRLQVWNKRGGE